MTESCLVATKIYNYLESSQINLVAVFLLIFAVTFLPFLALARQIF